MSTAHQHRRSLEADAIVRQVLSDPARRVRAVVAVRERGFDPTILGDAAHDQVALLQTWTALGNALYAEANTIRRKLGLQELTYDIGPLTVPALPSATWTNLTLYRELFAFWHPDADLPRRDDAIALGDDMARLIADRFPENRPYASYCRREAFEQLARECFGIKGDLFKS